MSTWFWITAVAVFAGFAWFNWWGKKRIFAPIRDLSALEERLRQLARYGQADSLVRVRVKHFAGQVVLRHLGAGLFDVTFPAPLWGPTEAGQLNARLAREGFSPSRAEGDSESPSSAVLSGLELPEAARATLSALDEFHVSPATADVGAAIEGPFDILEEHQTFMADVRALQQTRKDHKNRA